jgi:hypothetical protein
MNNTDESAEKGRWTRFKEKVMDGAQKVKKWGKKWGKTVGAALLKYGVPLLIGILTGNVFGEIKNIAKDLAEELGEGAPDKGELAQMDGESLLEYLKGMDTELGIKLEEMKGELEEMRRQQPSQLQEIFAGWKDEFSEITED